MSGIRTAVVTPKVQPPLIGRWEYPNTEIEREKKASERNRRETEEKEKERFGISICPSNFPEHHL